MCVISLSFSILVVKEGNKLKIVKCVSIGLKKGRHLCFLLRSTYYLSLYVCECTSVSTCLSSEEALHLLKLELWMVVSRHVLGTESRYSVRLSS